MSTKKKKMETCVAVRKRKISDVSDSSKIKLSESNDHRPKLKSRKHENCVALGFTANVVGTTTTNKNSFVSDNIEIYMTISLQPTQGKSN